MADRKIIDLPAIVSQQPTDLKEVSDNGLGSFKETRAQDLEYIQDNTTTDEIAQGSQNIYLSNDGKTTDNLVGCPNFDTLVTQVDELNTEITDHIANDSNPHETTLQQAYDQAAEIALNNGNVSFTNSTSGVMECQITDSKGQQFHAPIYHLVNGQSITLDTDSIDTIYSNDQAVSGSNSINLQLEASPIYSLNSTFIAWRNGTQPLSVHAPSGSTIDGVDAATIVLNPGQFIKFIKTALNTFVSLTSSTNEVVRSWNGLVVPVDVTAGSGIDITNGVISLTGSGPEAAYGAIVARQPTRPALSFSDTSTWKIISLPLILDDTSNNLVFGNDTYGTYIQNVGIEESKFIWLAILYMARNSNATVNNYYLSPFVSSDGISAPTIYSGGNDIVPFSLDTQSSGGSNNGLVPISYSNLIDLPSNAKLYLAIRNNGSTTMANNDLTIDTGLYVCNKAGDVGGASSGVTSLNGLAGDINLTSPDGSISINTAIRNIDLVITLPAGTYSPSIDIVLGASSVTNINAFYNSNTLSPGGIVNVTAQFDVITDNTEDIVYLIIPSPITDNFTSAEQAIPQGQPYIIKYSEIGAPGQIGEGCLHELYAETSSGGGVVCRLEFSQPSTTYRVSLSWSYQIQALFKKAA